MNQKCPSNLCAMACLDNDATSFDTPGGPGGASIVERKDFQANGHCGDLMSQRTILMIVATIPKNMNTIKKNVKQND